MLLMEMKREMLRSLYVELEMFLLLWQQQKQPHGCDFPNTLSPAASFRFKGFPDC